MSIANKDIDNFQALYAKRFGIEISKQQAVEMGTRLVNLFRTILQPSPQINLRGLNQTKTCQQKKK